MSWPYEYRGYRPGDEEHILRLFELCYGRAMPAAFWHWRWGLRPQSREMLLLAWCGDVLVGHSAVTPLTLSVEGREYAVVQTHTVMTHPEHRGRGLFTELKRRATQVMAERGAAMELAWPNHNSHRTFARDFSWRDIHEVPIFRKALDDGVAVPRPGLPVVALGGFDERFDRLWEAARYRFPVLFKRDREHLSWRYGAQAPQGYRIFAAAEGADLRAYAVCKRYEGLLDVVDVLFSDQEAVEAVLARTVEIAVADRLEAVTTWLNPSLPLHWVLEKWGFRNAAPVTYFTGLLLEHGAGLERVYDYSCWHLTMGDSDVY